MTVKKIKNGIIKGIITLSRRYHLLPTRRPNNPVPTRFLIVSTTGIGDTLWGIPAIRALRETFPRGYVGVLTNPAGFQVLQGNPDIDEIFIFQRRFPGYFSLPGLLKRLRKKDIDIIFIFHASDRIIWPLCFFTGAFQIVGTYGYNKGLDFILTRPVNSPDNIHGIERRLRLVKEVGASTSYKKISIYLSDRERMKIDRFLEENGIDRSSLLIGLHPGAQKPFKCWPARNFIEIGNLLAERPGYRIIITGDINEASLGRKIASKVRDAVPAAGKLSLRETAALIERMQLFITNDTGPMHIAFALKTPTIALFSPTDPRLCGPFYAENATVIEKPIPCNPCIGKECLNPVCMEQIRVEEVMARIEMLLGIKFSPSMTGWEIIN